MKKVPFYFTLIELLVNETCQICVLSLYFFKKSTPLFLKKGEGLGEGKTEKSYDYGTNTMVRANANSSTPRMRVVKKTSSCSNPGNFYCQ